MKIFFVQFFCVFLAPLLNYLLLLLGLLHEIFPRNISLIFLKRSLVFPILLFFSISLPKPLTVWITTNCGKFLKRCLTRNLYAGQEATVRTGYGTDWFQIGKGICQGCMLLPCLFNLYTEHITRNAGLGEAQSGIKIAGRNISNLR